MALGFCSIGGPQGGAPGGRVQGLVHRISGSVKHPQRVSRKMVRVWPSGEVVHTDGEEARCKGCWRPQAWVRRETAFRGQKR